MMSKEGMGWGSGVFCFGGSREHGLGQQQHCHMWDTRTVGNIRSFLAFAMLLFFLLLVHLTRGGRFLVMTSGLWSAGREGSRPHLYYWMKRVLSSLLGGHRRVGGHVGLVDG